MNRLRSLLKKRRAQADPRVRRRLFSWRMFVIILLVVSVLSAGNAFALEKLLKMQVFSVVASMGVGSYWVGDGVSGGVDSAPVYLVGGSTGRCARSAAPCAR